MSSEEGGGGKFNLKNGFAAIWAQVQMGADNWAHTFGIEYFWAQVFWAQLLLGS